jgi:hypothetical protein
MSIASAGFWVGCLPNFFSQDSGGLIPQDGFHLLAAIDFLQVLVVEGAPAKS